MRALTPCQTDVYRINTNQGPDNDPSTFTKAITSTRTCLKSYSVMNASKSQVGKDGAAAGVESKFNVKFQLNDAAKTDVFDVWAYRAGGSSNLAKSPVEFIQIPGLGILFEDGLHVTIEWPTLEPMAVTPQYSMKRVYVQVVYSS